MSGQAVITVRGEGPNLVLIHGWGMHSGVWGAVVDALARQYRVYLVDLPGHGKAAQYPLGADLSGIAAAVIERTPPAAWVGWSMGGLIALQAALDHPGRVSRLLLVACNPSFVVRPHWPDGVDETVFTNFGLDLKNDFEGTLNRFLVLETIGSDTARETLRCLRAELHNGPVPDVNALESGLKILRDSDYTARLGEISQPSLWLAGGRDRLVPATAMAKSASMMPSARYHRVRGAGHAPFIGHGDEFLEQINRFMNMETST